MTAGNTIVTIDALLKEYYDDGALVNETYQKKPLWAMLTKERAVANVTGRSFVHPVVYASSQGRAVSFSQAQANSQLTGELSVDFTVTRLNNYQVASVDTQTVLATKDDRGAFTKAITLITDNSLRNLGNDQEISMFGDGSGVRGNVSSSTTLASPVLKLSVPASAVYFEVGMELDLASSATATPRAYGSAGHGLYVIAVDRINGTLTVGTTPNPDTASTCNITDATSGIPTAAAGDFIFVRGDQGLKMSGISAWIPYGGPTSTSFYGVDRTVDPVRLAGNWLDATQLSIEDAFIQASVNVANQGYELTHFFVPFNKFGQLMKSQSAKVMVSQEVAPNVSFEGAEVLTPTGPVMVIPARNCPQNRMFGLNMDTWSYIHLGDPIQVFNMDGNTWLRQATADAMEIRFFSLGNLVCKVPASNITIGVNP